MSAVSQSEKLVIVLGMHRSGTSTITRALTTIGVQLGDTLLQGFPGNNDKGFFEDIDFQALNEELLRACNRNWFSLEPLQSSEVDMLFSHGYLQTAMKLLKNKASSHPFFALKDPRTAKLLAFWSRVFSTMGLDVHYVLTLRNPMSVSQSLKHRDDLAFEFSHFLWVDHVLSALTFTQGMPRTIVDYDQFVENPSKEIHRIAQGLGAKVNHKAFEIFQKKFLDHGLRHSQFTLEDLETADTVPRIAKEMYRFLLETIKCENEWTKQNEKRLIDQWRYEQNEFRSLFRLIDQQQEKIIRLSTIIATKNKKIAELNSENVRQSQNTLGLKAEVKKDKPNLPAMTGNPSWLMTRPIRELKWWISSPQLQTKKYIKKLLTFAKKGYQSLPLNHQTKSKHRQIVSNLFPQLLLATNSHPSSISTYVAPKINLSQNFNCIGTSNPDQIAKNISFTIHSHPTVSIIIPVYGKIDYSLHCLTSIARHLPTIPIEIIIIDDCSSDQSSMILSAIKGIRILKNDVNQGFIRSCNRGASVAKGQYLYFLNNDTEVTACWLDELCRTFIELPGTGFVGSKLIYPDGRLQEAGSIIWKDANAWNFGRNQDPTLPMYNYAREVDYCSGASIMVPTPLFKELGGFDEHYLPAYCEDADLALKIRDKGYRVIYQPLSTVIHFEGVTSGTDLTQGTKAYQIVNTAKLFNRWKDRLALHQASGHNPDQAKDRTTRRRVLILDHCTPTPDQDSGSIDAYNHMLLMREMGFQVTFIPEDNFLYVHHYTAALQRAGIEILYAPHVTSVVQHLKKFGARYDLVFIARPLVFKRNINSIRKYCPTAKVLFHTVDLHFLRLSREAELTRSDQAQRKAKEMKGLECELICLADMTTVVSSYELSIMKEQLPHQKIRLLPFARQTVPPQKGFNARKDIVFVGHYQHSPNTDAVKFFTHDIMPYLRQSIPGVRFYVVGSHPPSDLLELACSDIIVTDFISDLTSFLDNIRISVAPLRFGAGIKGKIGGAMAVGLPVVATSIATEGMSLTNGENILIADDPQAFAESIITLYQDESLWYRISKQSIEFADQKWGAESAWQTLADILSEIDLPVMRRAYPLTLYTDRASQP